MVLGSGGVNIIWKLVGNDSGVISELLEIDPEQIVNRKVQIWGIFPDINSKHDRKLKSQFQISTSSKESSPGTPFKMCSRS